MNALYERSVLGAIEYHEIFGEHDKARRLRKEYQDYKNKKNKSQETESIKRNEMFEGTLVAAGWDLAGLVNQSSLYTQDGEDILLGHNLGMKKFKPYLNQEVRIWGDVISNRSGERRVSVKKITRILDGFTRPVIEQLDEFGNLIALPA